MSRNSVIADLKQQIASVQASGSASHARSRTAPKKSPSEQSLTENDALKKIIALVNVSDRSEHAIRERLERAGFEAREIDDAVDRAKGYGFINDTRFAEVLVRSRIAQGKGSAGIERELAEHDIDVDSVPGWPYEYPVSSEEEIERALNLLNKKPPRSKNRREGAYRKLMQKGYPSSVASSAARIWAVENDW